MDGKRCLIKKKTRTARRTLEPLYQQQLEFKVEFTGKTLQVSELSVSFLSVSGYDSFVFIANWQWSTPRVTRQTLPVRFKIH